MESVTRYPAVMTASITRLGATVGETCLSTNNILLTQANKSYTVGFYDPNGNCTDKNDNAKKMAVFYKVEATDSTETKPPCEKDPAVIIDR